LDELGDIRELPVWVALMVLTTLEDEQATQEARYLLSRNQQEEPQAGNRAIIELVTTIMVYKFENKSRIEVEEMLGITLKETRVYREIKEEGIQEGEERGEQRGLQREKSLILRQLTRRVGELPQDARQRVETLPLERLENLGEALLDFTSMADFQAWFNQENI
jgi:predicted transposase YdaD